MAEEFRPDVILLDIGLPTMSGYDAARAVRAQTWGRDVVLCALTGWGQDPDRQLALDAGIDHNIIKPATLAAILRVVGTPRTQSLAT